MVKRKQKRLLTNRQRRKLNSITAKILVVLVYLNMGTQVPAVIELPVRNKKGVIMYG